MSNSRNIKRSIKRNISAAGMAALGTVTVGGVLITTAGTAFAAVPLTTKDATAAPPQVIAGTTGSGGTLTLTIGDNYAAGDAIQIPILDQASAPTDSITSNGVADAQSTQSVLQAVSYSAAPGVVAKNSAAGTTPTFLVTVTTNPNDSAALKAAGVQDMVVITLTNSGLGNGATTNTLTLTPSYKVGAQAVSGSVWAEPIYENNSAAPNSSFPFTASGTPAQNGPGTPLANAIIPSVAQTPTGVSSTAQTASLSNLAMKEVNYGEFATGVYTVKANNGTFSGTATITATGFTVQPVTNGVASGTAGSTASAPATSTGTYQFNVTTATTSATGPGSITISGITYTPAAVGPQAVTVTDPNNFSYQSGQPAVTVVNNPTVAGFTADDTAAQAAQAAANRNNNTDIKKNTKRTLGAVVLASDAGYQDALASSYLTNSNLPAQTVNGGSETSNLNPLLINPPDSSNEANTAAAQEIRKLGVGTVYVIGGTSAISSNVTNQLSKIQVGSNANGQPVYLQVIRIAGQTAEQTASQVAQYPSNGAGTLPSTPAAFGLYNSGASESATTPFASGSPVKTAVLADSGVFQDALSSSGLAAAYQLPVLLTPAGQGLDSNAAGALTNLGIQQVDVVGGSSAVSDQAVKDVQALGITVLRIAGTTFDATANELAQYELNDYPAPVNGVASTKLEGLDSPTSGGAATPNVGTSRGDAFTDALASAQLLGTNTLVTNNNVVPAQVVPTPVVDPLLLNTNTNTVSTGTGNLLASDGTSPVGGLVTYDVNGKPTTENIQGLTVFGGTLAQTPALVQAELNDIAAG